MPDNIRKEDLRVLKTHRALRGALWTLLERRGFERVTINDVCEEAQVSRATFYAHFRDKYDLLEHCLTQMRGELLIRECGYEKTEAVVNRFAQENRRVITNLIKNANRETSDLLLDFLFSLLDVPAAETEDGDAAAHTVLSLFCAGGMFNLLLWQVRNKFPHELQLMNAHTYKLLMVLTEQENNVEGEGA